MMNQASTNNQLQFSDDVQGRYTEMPPATAIAHCAAVKRVINVMHERLDEPFTLNDMSKIAYVSPYHFNRMFHQITGIPPCQFLYALRLETAKRLLLTTGVSVTDVCFDVGYNSLGTFIRRFTGLVGISPSRFRSFAH
jgi:transcriptional regulator GlxA family with amidase domain